MANNNCTECGDYANDSGSMCGECTPTMHAHIAALEAKVTNLIEYARHQRHCATVACTADGTFHTTCVFGPCSCGLDNVIGGK